MRPKGMQSIPSLSAIGERKVVGLHELATGLAESRAKVATSIARLEHERAGLQERLDTHAAIRAELETRLANVHELLSRLRVKMDEQLGEDLAKPVKGTRKSAVGRGRHIEAGAQVHEGPQGSYEVVSLEY